MEINKNKLHKRTHHELSPNKSLEIKCIFKSVLNKKNQVTVPKNSLL